MLCSNTESNGRNIYALRNVDVLIYSHRSVSIFFTLPEAKYPERNVGKHICSIAKETRFSEIEQNLTSTRQGQNRLATSGWGYL